MAASVSLTSTAAAERISSVTAPPICTPFEAKWNPNRVTGVPPIA